ncbi:MAG: hypothetical protein BGP16_00880 [Sphingobium sp. 66-54]|nr:MAG: hypothetical protein BGP16_00880 [Sphingobium sp. 66-54]
MAYKNRLGTATYEYDGDSIKLQSNLANLDSLAAATGLDFYEYLDSCKTPRQLAKLFYHLQFESNHSEAEIYAAFFADLSMFQSEENQKQLQEVTFTLMGLNYQDMIQKAAPSNKKK